MKSKSFQFLRNLLFLALFIMVESSAPSKAVTLCPILQGILMSLNWTLSFCAACTLIALNCHSSRILQAMIFSNLINCE